MRAGHIRGGLRAGTVPPGPDVSAPEMSEPRRRWHLLGRVLTWAFFLLVLGMVLQQARSIDWPAVGRALARLQPATIMLAVLLTGLSHGLYASYELIGRHLTGHHVPPRRAMAIGAASYAFNLNLGSLVGGLALRYRLYARSGLRPTQAAQVIGTSIATNWLGYLALAGALLTSRPLAVPSGWHLDTAGLRWVGLGLLVGAAAYLVVCTLAPQRTWDWHGHRLTTPSARVAVLQVGVSMLNWMTIAAVIWVLLQQRIDYPTVATVLLVAAVAGVITHVPAGLGVLEAVFLTLLAHRMPDAELLAALIAYRALYYLAPLVIGGLLLWRLERGSRPVPDGSPDSPG
jgi:glycosyltransferase 2 family protein